ncbi:MAG: cation transporter [Clostridia bacterium]|nr:cation transporter [Clostridia bacterium]
MSGTRIFWVTVLNFVITLAEVIGGLLSGSLALLSDSLHNLSDTVAIALSYVANRIAQRPKNPKKTFGYKRTEILAAFVNSTFLIMVSVFLMVEAVQRWRHPEAIDGLLMMVVATIGLLANLLSVILLRRESHGNINIKSSYLHLMSDTVSSVGVVLGGLLIKVWGWYWVDPLITLLISLYIMREAWTIVRLSIDILMQSGANLDYEKIRQGIEAMDGVNNIHHVHSWMTNENTIFFEAHLDLDDMSLCEVQNILVKVEHLLVEGHGISHVTLQPEVNKCSNKTMFG